MKKYAWINLILWTAVALILTAIMVVGIVFSSFSFSSFGFGLDTYQDADRYQVGAGSVSEPVTELEIHWVSGSVTLEPYDGETIEITESPQPDEKNQLRYRVHNGRLTVQYKKSSWFFGFQRTPVKHLTVQIPRTMAEAMRSLELDSVSAELDISGMAFSDSVEIDNVSGEISLRQITAGRLDIDTVSGAPELSGCAVGQLNFDSVSANLTTVDTSVREAETDTTSGEIRLELPDMPVKAEFDTVSGDVILAVRSCQGFLAEFDSVSGDFNSDFSFTTRDGDYRFGDGSSDLSFDSTSGDFNIRQLAAE